MTRISNLQTAGFDILVDNLPALLLIFKFALLSEYAVELKTSYRDGQRKAGCSWAGALAGAFRRHFAAFVRESKSSAIARRFPLSSYKRSTGWGKAGLHREGISLLSTSASPPRICMSSKRITPTNTNFLCEKIVSFRKFRIEIWGTLVYTRIGRNFGLF